MKDSTVAAILKRALLPSEWARYAAFSYFSPDMPFPERLVEVQALMDGGDPRAADVYSTIGSYLAYAIAHYAGFYEIRKVLLLGRVTTGAGGSIIIGRANEVLAAAFPELSERLDIVTPGERDKRHGQAVAAASLPRIER